MRDGSFDVGGCVDRLDDDDVVGMGGSGQEKHKAMHECDWKIRIKRCNKGVVGTTRLLTW